MSNESRPALIVCHSMYIEVSQQSLLEIFQVFQDAKKRGSMSFYRSNSSTQPADFDASPSRWAFSSSHYPSGSLALLGRSCSCHFLCSWAYTIPDNQSHQCRRVGNLRTDKNSRHPVRVFPLMDIHLSSQNSRTLETRNSIPYSN